VLLTHSETVSLPSNKQASADLSDVAFSQQRRRTTTTMAPTTRRTALLLLVAAAATQVMAWVHHLSPPVSARAVQRSVKVFSSTATPTKPESEFTMMGADGKVVSLSLAEKERIFVEALQSYYASGRSVLSDEDFDALKEELTWEGSEYATLNRQETKFLEAMNAYSKGQPILSDTEFDELKATLKAQNSVVAVSKEPRCFVETGVCSVTFREDKFRELLLYAPAAFLSLAVWVGGAYELVPASRSLNPVVTVLLGLPIVLTLSQYLTDKVIFVDPFIAQGPCPNCNVNNRIFFGDILGVDGPGPEAQVNCPNCNAKLSIDRQTLRVSTAQKA